LLSFAFYGSQTCPQDSDEQLFGVSTELSEITLKFRDRELAAGESKKETQKFDAEMKETE
jgi:hypothetical protein